VQRVVDPPVPGARQPVPCLLAGGGVDRRGAVVAGELVLGGEPGHIPGLGEDPPGDHRPDPEQRGQRRSRRGDQGGYLAGDELQPGFEAPDVGQVVAGDVHPNPAYLVEGADPGQQRLRLVRRQLAAHPARGELGQQPAQPTHRLSPLRGELFAPVAQQPQAHQLVIAGDRGDAGAVEGG